MTTSTGVPDLTACDREPIHIPGAIQPHGVMLVATRDTLTVTHAAGEVEDRLGVQDWRGRSLADLIGESLAGRIARMTDSTAVGAFAGQLTTSGADGTFDISARLVEEHLIVELEPGPPASPGSLLLARLEGASAAFERAAGLRSLCERAALEFRRLTGFDRVMIYRFLDDGAGSVVAEDRAPDLSTFLNHHFPATDIPVQARALYLRNLVRVIPDVNYTPAPLRPAWTDDAPLDMSDAALRSVSPIHIQYLKNMQVGASASVSIVVDGVLWGLIACHHAGPMLIPYEVRAGCRALAGALARQIKAKEAAEDFRDRLRLRGYEDEVVSGLGHAASLDDALQGSLDDLRGMMAADGVALIRGGRLMLGGGCPSEHQVRELCGWLGERSSSEPFVTSRLASVWPEAETFKGKASGLLAVTVSPDEPFHILWFRAEHVEVLNWAGNPHKAVNLAPGEKLTPRASFEAWSETVRGESRPWTLPEVEAAARLARLLLDVRQSRRLRELNLRLSETLADKETLLQQKDFLLREVNHRVQNSLQLVSGFLTLHARSVDDPAVRSHLEDAQQRVSAVALVHRRLYRADQVETIDLARYLAELVHEMGQTMGAEGERHITLDLSSVLTPADRAVTIGLIVTELVINANKYAYGGQPGPISISIDKQRSNFRLVVADQGRGKHDPRQGFGTRMMNALVGQLSGTLDYADNRPGLRAILTAPIEPA